MIAFAVGVACGVCLGVLLMGLCVMASRADDAIDRRRQREDLLTISHDEGVQYGHQLSQLRRRYEDEQNGGQSW